jgi:hypothetical protein
VKVPIHGKCSKQAPRPPENSIPPIPPSSLSPACLSSRINLLLAWHGIAYTNKRLHARMSHYSSCYKGTKQPGDVTVPVTLPPPMSTPGSRAVWRGGIGHGGLWLACAAAAAGGVRRGWREGCFRDISCVQRLRWKMPVSKEGRKEACGECRG